MAGLCTVYAIVFYNIDNIPSHRNYQTHLFTFIRMRMRKFINKYLYRHCLLDINTDSYVVGKMVCCCVALRFLQCIFDFKIKLSSYTNHSIYQRSVANTKFMGSCTCAVRRMVVCAWHLRWAESKNNCVFASKSRSDPIQSDPIDILSHIAHVMQNWMTALLSSLDFQCSICCVR